MESFMLIENWPTGSVSAMAISRQQSRSFGYLCNTLSQGQIAMNLLFATVVGFALALKPCEGASHFHKVRLL